MGSNYSIVRSNIDFINNKVKYQVLCNPIVIHQLYKDDYYPLQIKNNMSINKTLNGIILLLNKKEYNLISHNMDAYYKGFYNISIIKNNNDLYEIILITNTDMYIFTIIDNNISKQMIYCSDDPFTYVLYLFENPKYPLFIYKDSYSMIQKQDEKIEIIKTDKINNLIYCKYKKLSEPTKFYIDLYIKLCNISVVKITHFSYEKINNKIYNKKFEIFDVENINKELFYNLIDTYNNFIDDVDLSEYLIENYSRYNYLE